MPKCIWTAVRLYQNIILYGRAGGITATHVMETLYNRDMTSEGMIMGEYAEDPQLSPKDLAARWTMTESALAMMRHRDKGPAYQKFGKVVRYKLSDIRSYELHIRCSTTEQD